MAKQAKNGRISISGFNRNDLGKLQKILAESGYTPYAVIDDKDNSGKEIFPGNNFLQDTIPENITDGIVVCDQNDRIIYRNSASANILGTSIEPGQYFDLGGLMLHQRWGAGAAVIRTVLDRHGMYENTIPVKSASGNISGWIRIHASYCGSTGNRGQNLLYQLRDFTHQTEDEEWGKLMQSVVENTDDAVAVFKINSVRNDPMPRIVFVNQAFCMLTGYTHNEVVGRSTRLLLGASPDPEQMIRIRNAIVSHTPVDTELLYLRKDGTPCWVSLSIFPFGSRKGNSDYWISIQRDRTEIYRVKETLHRNREELMKANLEIDNFVYSASHDLRAPLASVMGLLELLKKKPDHEPADAYIGKIGECVNRLDMLTRSIIDYSHNSRLKPVMTFVKYQSLLRKAIRTHRHLGPGKKIIPHYTDSLGQGLYSDRMRWEIILNNLVSNSIKFAHPGRDLHIRLEAGRNPLTGNILIVYEDNGCGIISDQLGYVFDMFYRASGMAYGSGLGLYIVKQAVETLGGCIRVESQEGYFTRFIIELPKPANGKTDA